MGDEDFARMEYGRWHLTRRAKVLIGWLIAAFVLLILVSLTMVILVFHWIIDTGNHMNRPTTEQTFCQSLGHLGVQATMNQLKMTSPEVADSAAGYLADQVPAAAPDDIRDAAHTFRAAVLEFPQDRSSLDRPDVIRAAAEIDTYERETCPEAG